MREEYYRTGGPPLTWFSLPRITLLRFLAYVWPNFEVHGLDWQCCLTGSSKTAPRIFIFSIVLGAEYLSYVKSIETHARAFLPLNISAISSVNSKVVRTNILYAISEVFCTQFATIALSTYLRFSVHGLHFFGFWQSVAYPR